jgi:hypothetical protein
MPAAIPLVVMAAGAVASKVAANKQAKKQGQNVQAADAKYNDINKGFADKMGGIGDANRAQNSGILDSIMGGAGDLWNQAGSQNQPSFDPKMSDSQGFYKNAMNTGLFDEGQKNDFRARGAIQNDQIFQGLSRRLNQGANVRGGGFAGYSGQNALLQRDAARQGEENRLNTEGNLQGQIRQNMFGGAQGVASNDRDFADQGYKSALLQGQNLDRSFGQKAGVLGLLQGLRTQGTNDLPYYNQAGDAYRGYRVTPEQAGQPWYGAAGDAAQGVAGAYLGGMGSKPQGVSTPVQRIPSTKYNFNQLAR